MEWAASPRPGDTSRAFATRAISRTRWSAAWRELADLDQLQAERLEVGMAHANRPNQVMVRRGCRATFRVPADTAVPRLRSPRWTTEPPGASPAPPATRSRRYTGARWPTTSTA